MVIRIWSRNIKIFLDDILCPEQVYKSKGWVTCRNINDVMRFLRMGGITYLSLDGDMGLDNEGNDIPGGVELLNWMKASNTWPDCGIFIHSSSPIKKKQMQTIVDLHFMPIALGKNVVAL